MPDPQGQLIVPADIGVTFTASPTTDLHTGQLIDALVTVTNYGPAPAPSLELQSSSFFQEFSAFGPTDFSECFVFLTVADAYPQPYYYLNWPISNPFEPLYPPLEVGETRTCHMQIALSPVAPAQTTVTFGLPSFFVDLDDSNNTGAVVLERAFPVVPLLGPTMLWLLAALVAGCGAVTIGNPDRSQLRCRILQFIRKGMAQVR